MRSVNKVVMIGHLAADPVIRETKTGKEVANFSLATNRDWKTSEGEKKQITDYHRMTAWGPLAKICNDHLRKGMAVYVDGRLSNQMYEKEGEKKYWTEIVVDTMNMLSWNKKGGVEEVNLKETPA